MPGKVDAQSSSLTEKDLKLANKRVKSCLEDAKTDPPKAKRGKYNVYTPDERAQIGRYASENGPTRAAKHFSKLWNRKVPEPTARRLKSEYQRTMHETGVAAVRKLPTKPQGRPLLLGQVIDTAVQDYIKALRSVGGVVTTAIVMASAEGILGARDQSLLVQYGGHVSITKSWAKSLLARMGYVKRKCSTAGKMSVPHFKELQDYFLADIQAEVLMNDIPEDLIFNWDQTALSFVSTGQWTMHQAGAKVVPISHSDDKRQVTAVLAATLRGELLPPQIIYQGKTVQCHPKVAVPEEWDIWHSTTHWSNEETMKRYVEHIIVPFLERKRADLKVGPTHPALAIFDCFRGQTTEDFLMLLDKHNIRYVQVPPNCTDKLQPLDIAINKPLKDELKKQFHTWYASEVQKQLETTPVHDVKVDMRMTIIKAKSVRWFISAWQAIEARPEVAINGFRRAGILEAVRELSSE